jgi:predicted DNA-binding transcriptional regulator AlpA
MCRERWSYHLGTIRRYQMVNAHSPLPNLARAGMRASSRENYMARSRAPADAGTAVSKETRAPAQPLSDSPAQLLDIYDVMRLLRVSRQSVYNMMDRDELPEPSLTVCGRPRWRLEDITAAQAKAPAPNPRRSKRQRSANAGARAPAEEPATAPEPTAATDARPTSSEGAAVV